MPLNVLNLLTGSAGALVMSAAARALPGPAADGPRFYAWFYQFTHLILANFDKMQGNYIPPPPSHE